MTLKTSDFYFDLPERLIAQYPLANRTDSRLLVYRRDTQTHEHRVFHDLIDYLEEGDVLVCNDSRVISARLYGHKASGGHVEVLVERLQGSSEFLAQIKASKAPKPGTMIALASGWQIEVLSKQDYWYECRANGSVEDMLDAIGHIPLPPYISRDDESLDLQRYQTVYAQHNGSVAAPTAGLHFDHDLLARLRAKGVRIGYVTLHVGAGTFQPVRSEHIEDHRMHSEWFSVSQSLCDEVLKARSAGHRVIAVGTTALRALESAAVNGQLQASQRDTAIFIKPGYSFQVCDGLVTNFHLPTSTLLMLVAALIGYEQTMALYRIAVENEYRFFSYGDASLLL